MITTEELLYIFYGNLLRLLYIGRQDNTYIIPLSGDVLPRGITWERICSFLHEFHGRPMNIAGGFYLGEMGGCVGIVAEEFQERGVNNPQSKIGGISG